MTLDSLRASLADRYRIERELGVGGWATVYLAHDVKHDRKVAIKVLRPELAAVLGLERFVREIRTIAALQHPHILGLIDSGEVEGTAYYVMPFVDGESLRARLSRQGELPVREVVRTLGQVADALAYAHRHGVVHRDITPDNVLLSERHAMVADFGVAKALTQAASAGRLTETGVSVGTPVYMAPEQAAADPHVDHRADLYALGILGYEMLTGSPPFQGMSAQQVLAAKVTEQPVPLLRRRPTVPPRLSAVIMTCLEPRPADRYQSADELAAELETMTTPDAGTTVPPGQRAPNRGPRRLVTIVSGAAVLVVLGLAAVALLHRRTFSLTTSNAVPVTTEPGMEFQPALSPDGSLVAYTEFRNGRELVAVRSTRVLSGAEVRPAESDSGDQAFPTWSPDGEFLRFTGTQTLAGNYGSRFPWREVGRLGGAARAVPLPRTTAWTAWSHDSRSVAMVMHDSLFIYRADDSTARPLGHEVHSPHWSPDGRWIAYVTGNTTWPFIPNTAHSSVWIVPVAGGQPIEIAGGPFLNVSPTWLDSHHLLLVSDRDGPREVYAVEIGDAGPRGAPQRVPGGTDAHSISVSADGRRLAVAKLTLRQNIRFYPFRSAQPMSVSEGRAITSGSQVVETHGVSPDGQWLAYSSTLRGNADLFKVRVTGGEPVPLTITPESEFSPAWSPDGREIAYEIAGDLWVMSSDGGQPLQILDGPAIDLGPVWSPDGRTLAFLSNRSGRWETWVMRRDRPGGRWGEPVQLTHSHCAVQQWLPDGTGFLCNQGDSAVVLASAAGAVLWRRDLARAGFAGSLPLPALSRDGAIFYLRVMVGARRGLWSWPMGKGEPRLIVKFDNPSLEPLTYGGALSTGPDGLYLTLVEQESDIWVMDLNRSGR